MSEKDNTDNANNTTRKVVSRRCTGVSNDEEVNSNANNNCRLPGIVD